jgi:hypothetical protein
MQKRLAVQGRSASACSDASHHHRGYDSEEVATVRLKPNLQNGNGAKFPLAAETAHRQKSASVDSFDLNCDNCDQVTSDP